MCVVAVKKNQLLEGRGGRVEDVRPHLWLSWFAIQPHRRTATKRSVRQSSPGSRGSGPAPRSRGRQPETRAGIGRATAPRSRPSTPGRSPQSCKNSANDVISVVPVLGVAKDPGLG